ncbi:hypothetical protein VaNZ11_003402 [Volvox africanus]|uniref:Phosphodiesterase n=1 Tax=Volvox africanus TaxID=51714 RepID=A0ABQ5RU30_9CHLO|nr:hypothetical protein VaNZ11_003402 [Volvox africanus]
MWLHAALKRLDINGTEICRIARRYPATLIWPLLVLGLVLALGVWGVTRVGQMEENSAKSRAASLALDTAVWFTQHISVAIAPVQLMAAIVKHNPQYDAVQSMFQELAPVLMRQDPLQSIKQLEYVPNGIVTDIYPMEGNNGLAQGLDLFKSEDREGALKTVQDGELTLVGPMEFFEGGHGVIVRYPIFISGVLPNETFGLPYPTNSDCGTPCDYNYANKTKFWGFAASLIDLRKFSHAKDSKLRMLEDLGYSYEVQALGITNQDASLVAASSDKVCPDPVEAAVSLPNANWVVRVSPARGWRPTDLVGLMAGVVVVALALSLLLLAALVSRKRHQMLLEALLPKELIKDLHGAEASLLGRRILQAETTADLMLSLLNHLLEGHMPDLRDVVFIRQAIIRGVDLYQPTDLRQHIRNANLDTEVARALMQQLGNVTLGASTNDGSMHGHEAELRPRAQSFTCKCMPQMAHDCSTLTGALTVILTPQPTAWRDIAADTLAEPGNSESAIVQDVDAGGVISPRHSTYSGMLRAMSIIRDGGGGGGTLGSFALQPPTVPPGSAFHWRTGSMELVKEEDEQLFRRQLQKKGAEDVRAPDGVADREQPAPPAAVLASLPPHQSDILAMTVGAAGVESDDRLTPNSTSTAQDENSLGTGTLSLVRQLPRRVASAINILARPLGTMQRRSSLITAVNTVHPDAVLDQRLAIATSAAAATPAVATTIQRASVASMPEAAFLGYPAADAFAADALGLTTGTGLGTDSGIGGPRLLMTLAPGGGGGGGTLRRSQLNGSYRILPPQRAQNSPPSPPMIEEVERLLSAAGTWHFDAWRLRDITNGHPLSALGFYLIHRAGLITNLKLKPAVLARLLRHIEAGYNDNPYHNATHAADVLQTLHVIIHGAQLHVHYVDYLGLLAAYFAAIVHDYGHPGLTNDFLVATSDPLAVRYNDRSPLENHHAAAAFSLLQRPELDILAPLSKSERAAFRKQVIEMVLATDMKQHFMLLSQFNTTHRLSGFVLETASVSEQPAPGKGSPAGSATGWNANLEQLEVVVDMDVCTMVSAELSAPIPLDETERMLSLQLAIKAADLGHLGEELEVHQRWLSSLEEEFFRQGDRERQLGIPISPLFDRSKQGVSKSQVGFYEFVALPMVHALCSAFPGTSTLKRCFLKNYHHWRSVDDQQVPVLMPKRGRAAGVAAGKCTSTVTGASVTADAVTGATCSAISTSPPPPAVAMTTSGS